MTNKQIEELATSAVKKSIATTEKLDPYISENDKEPSWDGKVYIYKKKKGIKSDIIGRVDVQVKGKVSKNINEDTIKYKVSIIDLNNYIKDRGIVYFVVLISSDGEKEKIFYNSLPPIKIKSILNQTTNKSVITLEFRPFPTNSGSKTKIFMDFYENTQRQVSFVNSKLPTISNLEMSNSEIEIIHTMNLGEGGRDRVALMTELLGGDLYLYEKTNNIPIPFAEVGQLLVVGENIQQPIMVSGREYYQSYERIYVKDEVAIKIGKSMVLYKNNINKTFRITINIPPMLSDRMYDYRFLIDVFEKENIAINGIVLKLDSSVVNLPPNQLEKMKDSLLYIEKISKLFKQLNITEDLDLSKVTIEEAKQLNLLMFTCVDGNMVEFSNTNDSKYLNIQIQQLNILIYVEEVQEKPYYYRYINMFDGKHIIYFSEDYIGDKKAQYPAISILKKEQYNMISNINYDGALCQYKSFSKDNPEIYNQANWDALEMLLAYDICKKEKLVLAVIDIMRWLLEEEKIDKNMINICKINYFQAIYRLRELDEIEKQQLLEIYMDKESDNQLKFASNVLLKQIASAKMYYESLDEKIKEQIQKFPIYNLYEELN